LLEGLTPVADDREAFVYLPRLITFAFIILAIVQKNRPPLTAFVQRRGRLTSPPAAAR
jgi:hypothetical protein